MTAQLVIDALIELECDAFATLTLLYMNYQPLAFIEGIEGIGRDFPLHGVGFHPADAVRRRLVEQILPAKYIQIKPSISLSLQALKDTVKNSCAE